MVRIQCTIEISGEDIFEISRFPLLASMFVGTPNCGSTSI